MTKKIMFIFGTRPEAIKMAPLIYQFKKNKKFKVIICVTAQHREMLDSALNFFKIKPDFDLNIMSKNQTLSDITSNVLKKLEDVIDKTKPDLVMVQGDTTSAFAGALSAYYKQVLVAHIEAGLRSGQKYSPFPEEINRLLISKVADFHFAPTKKAKENLLKENIRQNVFVVGNTVIDALFLGLKIVNKNERKLLKYFNFINFSKKIILVTGHRRENFGKSFEQVCLAIKEIARKNQVEIIYPVHLNPNVQEPVKKILSDIPNIHLIGPLDYPYFIWLLNKSYFVISDSGGVQEEAPSLKKPILVTRTVTERTEGIKIGNSILVGTNKNKIIKNANMLINNKKIYKKMSEVENPYGDGRSSLNIEKIIVNSYRD